MSVAKKVVPPSKSAEAVRKLLDAKPGASGQRIPRAPAVSLYKVGGKLFAILTDRGTPNVILKCDPHLMELLKDTYDAIVHRSHLDKRYWMSVEFDRDVPMKEIRRMIDHSYDLVSTALVAKKPKPKTASRKTAPAKTAKPKARAT